MSVFRDARKFGAKQILIGAVCLIGFLTAIARIGTGLYYSEVMPRSPEPLSGRIYRAGAAFNTAVYVKKTELDWLNFLNYDMMSLLGIGVVLMAVFVIIPKARQEGRL
jgi:hypothetical protein